MPKSTMTNSSFRLRAVALAACCGVLLVGCGGGSSDSSDNGGMEEPSPPMLNPTEAARERQEIEQAIARARMAVNAVDDTATDPEVQAAEDAIMALETAIMGADNLPENEESAFVGQHEFLQDTLNLSKRSRDTAMEVAQRQEIEDAIDEAQNLVAGLTDNAEATEVQAAENAVMAIGTAIMNASNVPEDEKSVFAVKQEVLKEQLDRSIASRDMAMDAMEAAQREAINNAITEATNAVNAVNDGAEPADVQAAKDAIMALEAAIMDADNLPANEISSFTKEQNDLDSTLTMKEGSRNRAIEDQETAQKLYDGITQEADDVYTHNSGQLVVGGNAFQAGEVGAAYSLDGEELDVLVRIGTEGKGTVSLKEDKNEMVGNNPAGDDGWKGKQYMASIVEDDDPDDDEEPGPNGEYQAIVYSKVYEDEPPRPAQTFGEKYSDELDDDTGLLEVVTANVSLVKVNEFSSTSGTHSFNEYILKGRYDNAPGTYTCTGAGTENKCAIKVVDGEAELGLLNIDGTFSASDTGGVTWHFEPDDTSYEFPETAKPATHAYISYGWWSHTSEDDNTASAFVDVAGNVNDPEKGRPTVVGLDTKVDGTATYTGGAAGKYALRNDSAAGMNESGHFTAKVTLEANFTDLSIMGTINEFMVGNDGMGRPWSVELKEARIDGDGEITSITIDNPLTEDVDESATTVWMIDGTAADPSGTWSGQFYNQSADPGNTVPKVATGTFYSEYSDEDNNEGKMVGAFGVDVGDLDDLDL